MELKFQSRWGFSVRICRCWAPSISSEVLGKKRWGAHLGGRGKECLGKRAPISATPAPVKMLKRIIKHLEGSVERGTANMDLSNRSYFLMWQGDRSRWQKQMHVWSRCLAQSAHRQTQQVCGWDRSTAWWAQNGLESVTRRVLMISSLSKWKFWSGRAQQEAA